MFHVENLLQSPLTLVQSERKKSTILNYFKDLGDQAIPKLAPREWFNGDLVTTAIRCVIFPDIL